MLFLHWTTRSKLSDFQHLGEALLSKTFYYSLLFFFESALSLPLRHEALVKVSSSSPENESFVFTPILPSKFRGTFLRRSKTSWANCFDDFSHYFETTAAVDKLRNGAINASYLVVFLVASLPCHRSTTFLWCMSLKGRRNCFTTDENLHRNLFLVRRAKEISEKAERVRTRNFQKKYSDKLDGPTFSLLKKR